MPSVADPKACFSRVEKKIPNRVGARMQPCFTPLRMPKESDVEPSKTTVPFTSSSNDLMMLRSLGRHPVLVRILEAVPAHQIEGLCYLHFSYSCLRENIMSTVDLLARKPRFYSELTLSASTWRLFSATRAKSFLTMLRREMPR